MTNEVQTGAPHSDDADRFMARAEQSRRKGNGAEAEALIRKALALDPDHPGANNALGMRAQQRGDADTAAAHFYRATQADPAAPELWVNLAGALRRLGRSAEELTALNRALGCDQRHLITLIRLAEFHEIAGNSGAAAARWSNVAALIESDTDRPPALSGVLDHAQAYLARHQQQFVTVIDAGLADVRTGIPPKARRRAEACIDVMLGRRRIYHNVPHGLHFPFLPADEFFDRDDFPWLAQIEAQLPAIRAELSELLAVGTPGLEPYVVMDPGTPDSKWTPLDGSLDWGAYFFWKFGERIDAACARCPATAAALHALPLARIPGRAPTAFFSILKPHTRLPAHTGVTNIRAIIHLPLIVPEKCGFRVGGEVRPWREGEAFAFDDTIEHEAWNDSDEVRAVLIFDTWNPHIDEDERAVLLEYFAVLGASGLDPGAAASTGE